MKKHKGVVRMIVGEDLEVENILEYAKKELLGNFLMVKIVESTFNHWLQECWEPFGVIILFFYIMTGGWLDSKLKFEKDIVCIHRDSCGGLVI